MPNINWLPLTADEPDSKEQRLYGRRVFGEWDCTVWIGTRYPLACGYTHVADIEPPEVSDGEA